MKNISFTLSALCMLVAYSTLYGQETDNQVEQLEEIVISATKFSISKEKVGKIIYRVSEEEISKSKGKTVSQVLDRLASISINGAQSAHGKNKSVFIRGGRSHQVLVMIDGVPVTDPSGISASFDLRFLTLNQIASIEVMNGAASTLYGSGAGAGIINIVLKKAANKPVSFNYEGSMGTNNDSYNSELDISQNNHHISFSGSSNKFNYLLSTNYSKTDGLSEASSADENIKFESDVFKASNTFAKIGFDASENFNINLRASFDKDTYDYDAGGYADSDINNGENKLQRIGLSSEYKYEKGSVKLNVSFNQTDRMFDSYNGWTMATDHFEYTGKSTFIDVYNNYKINSSLQFIGGFSYDSQNNKTNSPYGDIDPDLATFSNTDTYLSFLFNAESGINLSAGIRLNSHSEYGSQWVYHFNPSYNLSNSLKVLASISTAYIAPSPYQLFSQYGNTTLDPEEDMSMEFGFEYNKTNAMQLSGLFFYREEKNAILLPDFVQYQNAAETLIGRGIESMAKIKIASIIDLSVSHTYTNKSSDLDYIPKNKFSALVEATPIKNTLISLQYVHLSDRTYFDQWGSGGDITIDSYGLTDLFASHNIIENKLTMFFRISNMFNVDFVETLGYSTRGRNYKVGLNYSL